jgi:hypothetical protein
MSWVAVATVGQPAFEVLRLTPRRQTEPRATRATTRGQRVSVVRRSTLSTVAHHAADLLFLSDVWGTSHRCDPFGSQRLATFNGSTSTIDLSAEPVNCVAAHHAQSQAASSIRSPTGSSAG